MMSTKPPSRGILLPGAWRTLVIAAAGCAGWLFWSEFSDRGWIPGVAREPDDPARPLRAVEAIVKRGRDGVPELLEAFADPDPKIRRLAIVGLERIGPPAADALPLIRGALTDSDVQTRANAVSALWSISQDPQSVAPLVARMLADAHGDVREAAARTLETIGRAAINPTIEMLDSDAAVARSRALRVLQKLRNMGSKDDIDAAVRGRMNDPDPGLHAEALFLIVAWGRGNVAEIRELMHPQLTVDPEPDAVNTALEAVAGLGPDASGLLPDVISLLDRQDTLEFQSENIGSGVPGHERTIAVLKIRPRFSAILRALSAMRTAAQPAIPLLLRRLDELHAGNRLPVAATLISIGANPDAAIRVLTPLLTARGDDSATAAPHVATDLMLTNLKHRSGSQIWRSKDTARHAGILLVRANPDEARRQASLLIPKLTNAETGVNLTVLYALWGLSPVAREAVPALIGLVRNHNGEVCWHAVVALGEIGPESAAAIPELVAQLDGGPHGSHRDGEILERIVEALGCIGPAAESALPVLAKVIDDPAAFVSPESNGNIDWAAGLQMTAISSVGQIGRATPQVLASLRAQLQSESSGLRIAAIRSLALLGGESSRVLADFVRLLRDESPPVRGAAALAIGRMTADRHEAVDPLVQALADENPYVRAAAVMALGRIGPDAKAGLPALRELLRAPGTLLPLWKHEPADWKPGMPRFEQISELSNLTIDEVVQTALREITAAS